MQAGVYQIVNTVNGMKYIGSTKDICNRWATHVRELNGTAKNKHHNERLSRAWMKYGEVAFRFDIIQHCNSGEEALAIENNLLKLYQQWYQWDELYNDAVSAYSPMLGRKQSEEQKRKRSEARKGFKHSEETKRKISEAHKGKKPSDACMQAAALVHKGNQYWKGRKHSEETKRKISEAHKKQEEKPCQ